jgi:hypothetical protein
MHWPQHQLNAQAAFKTISFTHTHTHTKKKTMSFTHTKKKGGKSDRHIRSILSLQQVLVFLFSVLQIVTGSYPGMLVNFQAWQKMYVP